MRSFRSLFFLLASSLITVPTARAQGPPRQKTVYEGQLDIPLGTRDRLEVPGWWPTKTTTARAEFVGPAECAKCHVNEAASWAKTPMSQASVRASSAVPLGRATPLTFLSPPYSYEIAQKNGAPVYSVTDGKKSLSATLLWAFGIARKGQTYIYQSGGSLHESFLSFYRNLDGLDVTTGQEAGERSDLSSALGRKLDEDTAQQCFRCHMTEAVTASGFDPENAIPGVTCEACHGPGAQHVAAMKSGRIEEGRAGIFNARRLNPVASVDYCGACHRTWDDAALVAKGVTGARFQPYRLEESKCWGSGDGRLACIACHNPHEPLNEIQSSYDKKCLACHVSSGSQVSASHPGKSCPFATKNCVACHMPRVIIPSMHAPFTDHRIRIARKGAPYPE